MTQPLQPAGVQATVANLGGFLAGLGQMNAAMVRFANVADNMAQSLNASGLKTAQQIGSYTQFANAMLRAAQSENNLSLSSNRVAEAQTRAELAAQRYELTALRLGEQMGVYSREEVAAAEATYRLNAAQAAVASAENKAAAAATQAQNAELRHQATLNSTAAASARYDASLKQAETTTKQASATVSQTSLTFRDFWNNLQNLANGFSSVVSKITGFIRSLSGAGSIVGGVGNFFSNFLSTLSAFITRDILGAMARGIRDIAGTAEEAAAELQTLTIRLENMIARQTMSTDKTVSQSQAFQAATGTAQELLGWIRQMAFATPFSVDKIAETTSFAIAMGWGVEEAKSLTKSILDFSAGMGLGSEVMDRIIYNFAQMKAAGKVTGTEMRDLARGAFFPLIDVLEIAAEKQGIEAKGLQELRKQAADGTVDIQTFFSSFQTWVNKVMPDAAAKLNFTMTALKSHLDSFVKTILGWDMLGPVVARFAEVANRALLSLTTPEIEQEFQLLGRSVLYAFNAMVDVAGKVQAAFGNVLSALGISVPTMQQFTRSVAEAVATIGAWIQTLGNAFAGFINNTIAPFASRISDSLGGGLKSVANKAFSWGANIVISLAEGIIKAASTAIAAAMRFLSGIFGGWLSPGSPPKILPDLNVWGAAAFTEYLKGFSMADFSALDSVQDAMKGALDALVELDQLTEEGGTSIFKSLSEDLIIAIDQFNRTGEIGTEIFKKLREVGGGFGDELADLLQKQIDLAKGTERAAQAEKDYKAAQQATKDATARVNTQIKEYNALLRGGADNATLKAKLAQVNAAEREKQLAQEREKSAEKANKAAQDALDPLKEAVSLQEKLIEELIRLAEAQKEAKPKGAGGGGGGGGTETPEVPELPEMPGLGGGGGLGDITKKLDDIFAEIRRKAEEKVAGLWKWITDRWKVDMGSFQVDPALLAKIELIGLNLRQFWIENGPKISATIQEVADKLGKILGPVARDVLNFILEKGVEISSWLVQNGPQITATIDNIGKFVANFGLVVRELWYNVLKPFLDWFLNNLLNSISIGLYILSGKWKEDWGVIGQFLSTTWEQIKQTVFNAWEYLKSQFTTNLAIIKGWWDGNWDSFPGKLNSVVGAIKGKVSEFYQAGKDLVQGLINGAASMIQGLIDTIVGAIQSAITGAKGTAKAQSPSLVFAEIGRNLMEGMTLGIQNAMQMPQMAIAQATAGTVVRAQQVAAPAVLSNNPTFNFNNTINNGMDASLFEQRVRQVIRGEL